MKKKGAIELSIGTIVIIVLAMSMLILGLVLVKNIFSGASSNILQMNDKVKDQINMLFVEDQKTVVYLPNQKAEIKQNEDWGIAFAIKNLQGGTIEAGRFSYDTIVSDPDVRKKCGVSEKDVESWIKTGRSDQTTITPGQTYYGIVRFFIPEGAPLCTVRFHLEVKRDNQPYDTAFFDIEVIA
ncbi:MAG: hypothetical protein NUV97_03310 [archaeon]|nr:hypothetical protein [archaeon]MCR4323928.1 hypothetical protein [Nanoarchaeota archaeon]